MDYKDDALKLINPAVTMAVLQKYDFHFKKKYGQNFLIDPHVLEKIIAAAGIEKNDLVLEIGPGIGTMTQYLCESAGHVTAIEIDQNLLPVLSDTLSAYDNADVINGDVLKLDLNKIIKEKKERFQITGNVRVTANLPYYITTPIIMGLFEKHVPVKNITVMVQKEVADRMKAHPGGKDYGALSLAVQYYSKPEVKASVPPNCFVPRPKVTSEVITLECLESPAVKVKDEKLMFSVIRAAFNQRRKTLVNALSNAGELNLSKDQIRSAVNLMGLSETVRGEALSLEEFAALTDLLYKK